MVGARRSDRLLERCCETRDALRSPGPTGNGPRPLNTALSMACEGKDTLDRETCAARRRLGTARLSVSTPSSSLTPAPAAAAGGGGCAAAAAGAADAGAADAAAAVALVSAAARSRTASCLRARFEAVAGPPCSWAADFAGACARCGSKVRHSQRAYACSRASIHLQAWHRRHRTRPAPARGAFGPPAPALH